MEQTFDEAVQWTDMLSMAFLMLCAGWVSALVFLSCLYHDENFRKTRLGRFLLIVHACVDVNGPSLAYDSTTVADDNLITDEESSIKQCAEQLSKVAFGLPLPDPNHKPQTHETRRVVWHPNPIPFDTGAGTLKSYYAFLQQRYPNPEQKQALKDQAQRFATQEGEIGFAEYRMFWPHYVEAMKRKGQFNLPFDAWRRSFSHVLSFHSFGNELHVVKKRLELDDVSTVLFAVNMLEGNIALYVELVEEASFPTYKTLDNKQDHMGSELAQNAGDMVGENPHYRYGRVFGSDEFAAFCANHPNTVALVRWPYAHWAKHGKSFMAGKQFAPLKSWYRIMIGCIMDDNLCWRENKPYDTVTPYAHFVHVNPVLAAVDPTYFFNVFKPSSIYRNRVFWIHVGIFGASLALFFLAMQFFPYVCIFTMLMVLGFVLSKGSVARL